MSAPCGVPFSGVFVLRNIYLAKKNYNCMKKLQILELQTKTLKDLKFHLKTFKSVFDILAYDMVFFR